MKQPRTPRAVLLAMAIAAAIAAGGCEDDDPPAGPPTAVLETTPQPRPVSAGYCLVAAGVRRVFSASSLSFARNAGVERVASGRTGVGKATASFKAGRNYVYVVAKPRRRITQSGALSSPRTYEFVGVARAPGKRERVRANDCLDGLVGDDR